MLVSDFFRAQARKLEKEAHVLFMAINTQENFLFMRIATGGCSVRLRVSAKRLDLPAAQRQKPG